MGGFAAICILIAMALAGLAGFLLSEAATSPSRRRWEQGTGGRPGLPDHSRLVGSVSEAARRIPIVRGLVRRLERADTRRRQAIREQLPMVLRSLSSSLSVGQSTYQAFEYVADNTQPPLGPLLKQVVWDVGVGIPLHAALARLSERTGVPEMNLVCAAFSLQQKSGGSIRSILQSAADSIRASTGFERQIRVQTAQARLSVKVIAAVPVVLLVLLALVSPDYLATFFGSAAGFAMFLLAVFLEVMGLVAVTRIVRVRR